MKVAPAPSTNPAAMHRVRLTLCILAWFLANGSTVIFNKYIFKNLQFRNPLTLTFIHMTTQSVLAFLTIDWLNAVPKLVIEPADYYSKILVISMVFCCNICLGNVSLNFVPVSFMQTVKSLTPATTACLQYMLFGSRLTTQALLSLIPITSGVALASITELEFHVGGFIAALASCVLTGLKFVLSSQLFAGRYKFDSINLLYYMAPPSAAFLLIPVFLFESNGVLQWWNAPERTYFHLVLLLLSGILSFILNVSILVVLKATSSVTVTVAGNVKTVLVIGASILIFNNAVTPLGIFGCLTAIGGCMWYGIIEDKWATMGTMIDAKGYRAVDSQFKPAQKDMDAQANKQ